MASSRRRFLIAAGAAVLAGCDEPDRSGEDRTATPVDVPRSAADVLERAEQVPVPSVPPATVISDGHRRTVVEHADDRIETAEETLASAEDVTLADVADVLNSEGPFERARHHLAQYRKTPSRPRFRRLERALGDVTTVLGYVRAATGDLDVDAVRTAIASDRADQTDLSAGPDYRLASPIVRYLPTVGAAEASIERAGDSLERAERAVAQVEEGSESQPPAAIGVAWRTIEEFRLERTNAAGYLETAIDPGAAPRADALADAVRTQLDALSELHVPRRVDGGLLPPRVRAVLTTVRSRRSSFVAAAGRTDTVTDRRVELLLGAVGLRNRMEAFADAIEATFERPGDDGLPNDRLPPAKRRAVDRIDALAGGAPLQRRLGRDAVDLATAGDRVQPDGETAPVTSAHFMYVAARAYADLALTRGERLATSLGDA